MKVSFVLKCSLDIEEYGEIKMSVLISPSKSLISSRWVTFNGYRLGRGDLVEKRVRRCVIQIWCLFGLLSLPVGPFLFENWFTSHIGSIFAKCLIFHEFFLWFTYRLLKRTYASQFTW